MWYPGQRSRDLLVRVWEKAHQKQLSEVQRIYTERKSREAAIELWSVRIGAARRTLERKRRERIERQYKIEYTLVKYALRKGLIKAAG